MGSPRSNESSNVSSHCNCSETFYHKDCKSRHFPLHYSEIQAYDPEFVAHLPQFLAEGFGEGLFQISCHLEQVHQLGEQMQHEHSGDLEQLGEYGQLEQIGEHEEPEQLGQFGQLSAMSRDDVRGLIATIFSPNAVPSINRVDEPLFFLPFLSLF